MALISLVVAKHEACDKNYLFYAPYTAFISAGDKVVVDTRRGEQVATVESVTNCVRGDDVYNTITALIGWSELKRVIGKVRVINESEYSAE